LRCRSVVSQYNSEPFYIFLLYPCCRGSWFNSISLPLRPRNAHLRAPGFCYPSPHSRPTSNAGFLNSSYNCADTLVNIKVVAPGLRFVQRGPRTRKVKVGSSCPNYFKLWYHLNTPRSLNELPQSEDLLGLAHPPLLGSSGTIDCPPSIGMYKV
jgi:hypothetical protein